jgi:hypothetical protein
MKIRKADLTTDLQQLRGWMEKWQMTTLPDWWYPEDNYMIDGIIFASYYKTNSKLAYLENIVSNPDCIKEDRYKAVELISKHIFKQAKEDGFNLVCGWTNNKSIIKNCNQHGMHASKPEYSVLIMDVR